MRFVFNNINLKLKPTAQIACPTVIRRAAVEDSLAMTTHRFGFSYSTSCESVIARERSGDRGNLSAGILNTSLFLSDFSNSSIVFRDSQFVFRISPHGSWLLP